MSECRNDCSRPLRFPKPLYNRPGLSHVDYRIGTYADIREWLLRNLDKQELLQTWTHRGADDPGIALLEGAAILGDILTFYQDVYANEAFLRTAQWRESISNLVRLLGYRLSPGVGGTAAFAFTFKKEVPVVVPAGFPLQAQVEGLENPAVFETSSELTAYPALSSFHLYRPTGFLSDLNGASRFSVETSSLEAAGVELQSKDRLMLLDEDDEATENAQIVVVKGVSETLDRTVVEIEGALGSNFEKGLDRFVTYKLGRTFRHFGHNSPYKVVSINSDGTASQVSNNYNRNLAADTGSTSDPIVEPSFASDEVPLGAEVDDIPIGSDVIIQGVAGPNSTIVRGIIGFRVVSMTWGSLSGPSTIVAFENVLSEIESQVDIRQLSIHETCSTPFELRSERTATESVGPVAELYFFGDAEAYNLLEGRTLFMVKPGDAVAETTVTINHDLTSAGATKALRKLTLNAELPEEFTYADFPLIEPSVTVYGNVAKASQGKTEKEAVLGNGDNRERFQTFKLPKAPLTYHNSAGATPPEVPELEIYVNDLLWSRVSSFFGHLEDEEIYIVREDANGDSWVQFGDGRTGARLPSGQGNVIARYRTGTGAYGALEPDTTVSAQGKLDNLDKVTMPDVASGGDEPETGQNAREAAPGKIQSLDRLVSLKDFETETLAIPGVTRAVAAWELVENVPTIVLTVLMETGRSAEIEQVRRTISDYNKCRGPQRWPVIVKQGKFKYVYLDVVYGIAPRYQSGFVDESIKEHLGTTNAVTSTGLFSLRQRRFGQREYATRVTGIAQNVEGVVWAKVKAFGSLGEADDPSTLSLPSYPSAFHTHVAADQRQVLALYPDHLSLQSSSVQATEVCS